VVPKNGAHNGEILGITTNTKRKGVVKWIRKRELKVSEN
jgi:hypothetical protein